jgi:YD repeat-containing protein
VATEYRYDANGNTTRKIENGTQKTIYTWNQENLLIGVQTPTGENISYAYDADGVRVSKTVNGVTTEFLLIRIEITLRFWRNGLMMF